MKIEFRVSLFLLVSTLLFACKKPEGLEFTGFQDFNIQPLSFTKSNISFGIGVYNPNNFDIRMSHLDADVNLADTRLDHYQIDSLVVLKGKKATVFPVKVTISNGAIVSNILSVLAGDSLEYSVKGQVRAGRKIGMAEIPFSYSGHLSQRDFIKNPEEVK